jgi:hypothetical protein
VSDSLTTMERKLVHVVSNGRWVEAMPNYYFQATGRYYFAGLYTAVLPMIPGIYGIYRVVGAFKARAAQLPRPE